MRALDAKRWGLEHSGRYLQGFRLDGSRDPIWTDRLDHALDFTSAVDALTFADAARVPGHPVNLDRAETEPVVDAARLARAWVGLYSAPTVLDSGIVVGVGHDYGHEAATGWRSR